MTMHSSYSKYIGTVTNIKVNKSGGVIMAAVTITPIKACLLYRTIKVEVINSSLANINATTGN